MLVCKSKMVQQEKKCIKVDDMGNEIPKAFESLKAGDNFKLIEIPVNKDSIIEVINDTVHYETDKYGNTLFTAISDAYYNQEAGTCAIDIEDKKRFLFIGWSWKEIGIRLNLKYKIKLIDGPKAKIVETDEEYIERLIKALKDLENDKGLFIIREFLECHVRNYETAYKPLWITICRMIELNDNKEVIMLEKYKKVIYEFFKRNVTLMSIAK